MPAQWLGLLSRNLDTGTRPARRWAQLATVRPDGAPANRTVVYRGLFDGIGLQFTTDRRSAKMRDLAHEPRVEVCWNFAETGEQLRVAGKMETVQADTGDATRQTARVAVWRRLSDAVRAGFVGGPPGRPLAVTEPVELPSASAPPPDAYVLLILWPERVDHVTLATTPHQRRIFARDAAGAWHARPVHP